MGKRTITAIAGPAPEALGRLGGDFGVWGGARWFKDNLAPKDKADEARPSLY